MPTYRVHDRDWGDRTVQAARVITDGAEVCFESQIAGRWQSALSLPGERVLRLQRRINEHDGRWRWIVARAGGRPSRAFRNRIRCLPSAVADHMQGARELPWVGTG